MHHKPSVFIIGDRMGLDVLRQTLRNLNFEVVFAITNDDSLKTLNNEIECIQHIDNSQLCNQVNFFLGNNQLDFGLCFSYNKKIPAEVFNLPRLGTLNLHGGKLPEYRGANVINWALINGETEIAITLHRMTASIDEGPIISSKSIPVLKNDNAVLLRDKIFNLAPVFLNSVLPDWIEGKIVEYPQSNENAKYYPKRRPEDGMVSWEWPAEKIYNYARALVSPWPGIRWITKNGEMQFSNANIDLEQVVEIKKLYEQGIDPMVGRKQQ